MDKLLQERLRAKLESSFDAEVQRKVDSFGGLLTRGAAVRLLCQEGGISTEEKILLKDARATLLPFSFSARVERVFPVQGFGGGARSVRLHISDAGGEATLVLWGEQVRLGEGLLAGDNIECSGAYARAGEIAIGRSGSPRRQGAGKAAQVASLREGVQNVEGVVEKAEGARTYRDRKSDEEKTMCPFTLSSGGRSCRAVWWSPPLGARLPRQGEAVVLENASFRDGELHLGRFSRVVVQGASAGSLSGEFSGIAFEGGKVALAIGAEKFALPESEALALLGIRQMQSAPARTLLIIKARSLEGKAVSYSAEGGRLLSLEAEA